MQILQKYEQMIQQVLTPQNGNQQIPLSFIQQCKLELSKIRSILDLHKNAEQEIAQASTNIQQGQRLKDALRNKQLIDETAHDYLQLSMKQTFFEQLSQITNRGSLNTSLLSQNNTSFNSVINQYQLSGLNKSFQNSITQKPTNQELLIFKEPRQQSQVKQPNVKEILQNHLNQQRQISTQLSQYAYIQRQQPQDMAKMVHDRLSNTDKPVPHQLEDLPKYFNEKRRMQEANTQPLQSFQATNGQSMNNTLSLEDEAARIQENSQKEFLLQRVKKLNLEKQQQTIEIQQLKSDIASLNQILKVKSEQLEQLMDKDGQQHSIDEMQKVLDTLNEQSAQITELQEKCKEYEAQLDPMKVEALETQLNTYKTKYETLLDNSRNQADYGSLVKEQTKTIKVMEADNQQLTLEIKNLKQANEKLQQELTNTQILIDKSLYGSGDFSQELNQKDDRIRELQNELERVKAELEQLKAQKEE